MKSLNTGSEPFNSDKVSFLYAKSMLDTVVTDCLLGSLSHMMLARLKKHLNSPNATKTKTSFGDLESSVSAAAYTVATCIYMHRPKFSIVATTVIPSSNAYQILYKNQYPFYARR